MRLTPPITAITTLAVTLLSVPILQRLPGQLPTIGDGILTAGYVASAFWLARIRGWRRGFCIGASLLSPLWIFAIVALFSLVGFALGLHDDALPGEGARQSFQDIARPTLGIIAAASIIAVWTLLLGACTLSLPVGLGVLIIGAAAFSFDENSPTALYMWHGSLCAILLLWGLGKGQRASKLARVPTPEALPLTP